MYYVLYRIMFLFTESMRLELAMWNYDDMMADMAARDFTFDEDDPNWVDLTDEEVQARYNKRLMDFVAKYDGFLFNLTFFAKGETFEERYGFQEHRSYKKVKNSN